MEFYKGVKFIRVKRYRALKKIGKLTKRHLGLEVKKFKRLF